MKSIIIIIVFIISNFSFSQSYKVISEKLNIRNGQGTQFEILHQLEFGNEVRVLEKNASGWWKIQFLEIIGYVASKNLKEENYETWDKKSYASGTTPDCENISPEYDYKIDNYLKIQVGNNTDVVVKLMQKSQIEDKCIRVVYINSGETYDIKNIPEGLYYLKIAYGKDYRQTIVNKKCKFKFIKSPIYEKSNNILDFNKIKTSEGYEIPSYGLDLDVITTYVDGDVFNSGNISEEEFNN
jgi:putative component of toxin-antitoxin plasmid stabilization module